MYILSEQIQSIKHTFVYFVDGFGLLSLTVITTSFSKYNLQTGFSLQMSDLRTYFEGNSTERKGGGGGGRVHN